MKLVADANVLLSAVLGGSARIVLSLPEVDEIFTAEATLGEVQEYAAILAQNKRLSLDTLLLAVATLPVSVIEREICAQMLPQARRLIGRRNPDDIEILALALQLRLPIWSNDNDFEEARVEWYTTAELLQKLGSPKND